VTASLKARLCGPRLLVAPGAYDALTARLVERAGFEAVYLSGAGVAYTLLGQPDVGLVTATEMAERVACVARATSLPVIADGDNGHGNALNVQRTVRLFEDAGARAIQLEDQTFPKRCGHLGGARLIPAEEMAGKVRAAVEARRDDGFVVIARTDARGVSGLDDAIRRAARYREAGADVLFVEAPRSREELLEIARALPGVPLVLNQVEGGKTPLVAAAEAEAMGYRIAIWPNALVRRFVHAGRELLGVLAARGTTESEVARMVSFEELQELVGLEALGAAERRYVP
jgi:2-methylisocitrate lyase-like PEP mutase family enzyme